MIGQIITLAGRPYRVVSDYSERPAGTAARIARRKGLKYTVIGHRGLLLKPLQPTLPLGGAQ
jgi:hypothetical protein